MLDAEGISFRIHAYVGIFTCTRYQYKQLSFPIKQAKCNIVSNCKARCKIMATGSAIYNHRNGGLDWWTRLLDWHFCAKNHFLMLHDSFACKVAWYIILTWKPCTDWFGQVLLTNYYRSRASYAQHILVAVALKECGYLTVLTDWSLVYI